MFQVSIFNVLRALDDFSDSKPAFEHSAASPPAHRTTTTQSIWLTRLTEVANKAAASA
jgi:hypothetical protein